MPLKIAFGTTLLERGLSGQGIDGIGQYCDELLRQYTFNPDIEIAPYTFGITPKQFPGNELPAYPIYLMQAKLPGLFHGAVIANPNQAINQSDIIHSTDQLIPIGTNKPVVATVMDVIPLSHPHFLRSTIATTKAKMWRLLLKRVNHIITISNFSKLEIIRHTGVPEQKISVIPLGVDDRYFEKIARSKIENTLAKYSLPKNFFLSIGTIQPRKNLTKLIAAHQQLPHDYARQFPLVIAGRFGWGSTEILSLIRQGIADKRCYWVDYVNDFEKRCLLQAATALTFTSLYEGFGLPITEAFASGAPVITSNCTSMPEIAGDAAVLVDPNNISEITSAMFKLIEQRDLRENLITAGNQRALEYNWEKVALATSKIYRSL
jgi:alpha-1,3-rhamnosyl/mannosyltransferase